MVPRKMILARLAAGVLLAAGLNAQVYPKRIISTAPSITEMLFALGLGDRVVGVTQYCKYPKEVAAIPKIGSWTTPNMEVILAARPDLIMVQRTAVHDKTKFQGLGLKTLEVSMDRVQDILASAETIAAAAGVPERGRALRASIEGELEAVRRRVASRPRTKAMFIVGRNPGTLEGVIAAMGESYISEVIAMAGGENIFADSKLGYAKVIHEEILARNPEVIIDMGEHPEGMGISEEQKRKEIALWRKYPTLKAARENRIHIVANEVYIVPGPRVVVLARELARLLHPELYH